MQIRDVLRGLGIVYTEMYIKCGIGTQQYVEIINQDSENSPVPSNNSPNWQMNYIF